MNPKISVVVPAYNRQELLKKTIEALGGQSIPKNIFEVLIVHGSDTEVGKLCRNAAENAPNFSCFYCGSESPSKKRNIGIRNARGAIVAFTDDDCIPDRGWLEEIIGVFEKNPGIAGVEGITYTEGKRELYSNAPVNLKGGLFPTCNLSFRKGILEKIGGFDESYRFYREDTDIAFRAMDFGEIIFCGKARVFHPQRKVGLMRPIETLGLLKEDVRLFRKLPEKYARFLGKGFISDFLKAAVSWLLLAAMLVSAYFSEMFLAAGGLAAYGIFWHLVTMRMRKSAFDFFVFAALNFLRGIAFPFYFIYYLVTVK